MGSRDAQHGPFIVLDGVDGCGKSTQAGLLVECLRAERGVVRHLREPGTTALGEALRELLLSREMSLGAEVESLLFCAARRQMLDELVSPALAAGEAVVCERFHPSTYAYQAVAGGVDEERLLDLLQVWSGTPRPDLMVLLDVAPEQAAARRGAASDRIEDKGLAFQVSVADGMRRYASRDPGVRVVDGSGSPDEVALRVLEEVRRVL